MAKTKKKPHQKRSDVIRDNGNIRKRLKERFAELNLNLSAIISDAAKLNKSIDMAALQRYLNDDTSGRSVLKQEDVIWLCIRYLIHVGLKIQKLTYTAAEGIKAIKEHGKKSKLE
jgi:hypothetical protein